MRTNLPELFRSFAIPAYRFATPSKSFRIPSLALFHSFFRSPELPEYFCTLKFHFGFLFCHRCLIFKVLSPPLSRSGLLIFSYSLPFVNTFFKLFSTFFTCLKTAPGVPVFLHLEQEFVPRTKADESLRFVRIQSTALRRVTAAVTQ